MTSDAKIGLLLGLVFIFIIAFIINGLPSLRNEASSNELTANMVNSQNSLGIADKEREVIDQSIRFETILPKSPPALETKEVDPANPAVPAIQPQPQLVVEGIEKEVHPALPVKRAVPEKPILYIVCDGDNLAAIAKKFYGSEAGNKKINIDGIVTANRNTIKYQDEICIGQKLVIPPLPTISVQKSKIQPTYSAMSKKTTAVKKVSADNERVRKNIWYIVREGDSLWRIAADQMGDGNRYREISKLNADIIGDEYSLAVGMRLKMPTR